MRPSKKFAPSITLPKSQRGNRLNKHQQEGCWLLSKDQAAKSATPNMAKIDEQH